jgi:hypothetical protein
MVSLPVAEWGLLSAVDDRRFDRRRSIISSVAKFDGVRYIALTGSTTVSVGMPDLRIHIGGAELRATTTRLFLWLAVAIVCISLTATYFLGVERGLRDAVGTGSWGRILFGVGTAVTQMDHGGYGYALSTVIETVLTYGGLTNDPKILAPLGAEFPGNLRDSAMINAAIDKAARFKWPFNPEEAVRGSGGDDLGFVDYVRLSFLVFGHNIQSLYNTYFLIFGVSAAAFLYTFRSRPAFLMLLIITSVVQIILFSSNLFDSHNLGSLADPRFLSVMAIIPGLHLGCLLLERPLPSISNVLLALVQSIILVFAFWIRASAVWVILAVALFAGPVAAWALIKRRSELRAVWRLGILAVRTLWVSVTLGPIYRSKGKISHHVFWHASSGLLKQRSALRSIWWLGILLTVLAVHTLWVTITLHPIYRGKGEISHHVFWHAVFYQLQFHPRWNEKYAASYDFATVDELPAVAARKYLLQHPPLNPENIYLTEDRRYLRVASTETYIRKAFFEFLATDPRFVLESMLIYNPRAIAVVFAGYLSSLNKTSAIHFIGVLFVFLILAAFLAVDTDQRHLFKRSALLATGGFFVSLSPILITVASYPTMGEQYLALLIAVGCWSVLALASALRVLVGQAGEKVVDGIPRAS